MAERIPRPTQANRVLPIVRVDMPEVDSDEDDTPSRLKTSAWAPRAGAAVADGGAGAGGAAGGGGGGGGGAGGGAGGRGGAAGGGAAAGGAVAAGGGAAAGEGAASVVWPPEPPPQDVSVANPDVMQTAANA